MLSSHNKRLVVVSSGKLLSLCGFDPELETCTTKEEKIEGDAYFSTVQGGLSVIIAAFGAEPLQSVHVIFASNCSVWILKNPEKFVVRGADLMQLEQTL